MYAAFNHYMLWVKDLDRAMKFYGEGLGMPFLFVEHRMPTKFNKAYYGSESAILEIFELEDPNEFPEDFIRDKRPGITHFCIWVDSLDKTVKRLEDAGFPGALQPWSDEVQPSIMNEAGVKPDEYMRATMMHDPEGNPIEVFERAEVPK